MNRRVFLTRCAAGVLGAVGVAQAASAGSFEESVVTQLRGQGYRDINVARTMLGRVRIVGARRGITREIILNPRTGEILRDVVLGDDGQVSVQISDDDTSGSGRSGDDSSGDDGGDDDGDDGGDDGGGDDHGGEDGGGSGSGSGSGSGGGSGSGHGDGGGDNGDD